MSLNTEGNVYFMLEHIACDVKRLLPDTPATATALRHTLRGLLSPGFHAIIVYRSFRWAKQKGIPTQPLRFLVERFVEITTGISIPIDAEFGPGLRIHHFGSIIVHPAVKAGSDCTLYHDVTLGTDGISEDAPRLGDNVLVGAGAKILGGVTLGDRCRIGANAVVVHSFPDDSVLVGIPARDMRSRKPANLGARS